MLTRNSRECRGPQGGKIKGLERGGDRSQAPSPTIKKWGERKNATSKNNVEDAIAFRGPLIEPVWGRR